MTAKIRCFTFVIAGMILLPKASVSSMQSTSPCILSGASFCDDFSSGNLDTNKWETGLSGCRPFPPNNNPIVDSGGELVLFSGRSPLDCQLQSKEGFAYKTLPAKALQMEFTIRSFCPPDQSTSCWQPNNVSEAFHSDSSFGLESYPSNNCHYAIVVTANGFLGVLRSVDDPAKTGFCKPRLIEDSNKPGGCIDDPTGAPYYQSYSQILNWETLRMAAQAGQWLKFTLTWSPPSQSGTVPKVELVVTSDGSLPITGAATIEGASEGSYSCINYQANGEAVPTDAFPLRIRFNSNPDQVFTCEDWRSDYVRIGTPSNVIGPVPSPTFDWHSTSVNCRRSAQTTSQ